MLEAGDVSQETLLEVGDQVRWNDRILAVRSCNQIQGYGYGPFRVVATRSRVPDANDPETTQIVQVARASDGIVLRKLLVNSLRAEFASGSFVKI
jgi:hypothetical protein